MSIRATIRPAKKSAMRPLFGSGLSSWDPTNLFAPADVGLWLDIQDLSTLFQDSAGTTPAGVGDPVGLISDKSGKGNDMVQATSSLKPLLRQDVYGAHYLELDGVDDLLQATFAADPGDCTMVFCGPEETTAVYPLAVTATFSLHTGLCYNLFLINRQLTAVELGSAL